MHVIHLSAECYPVAKAGGLGDVVGALPKYQQSAGVETWVVMPFYQRPFMVEHTFDTVFNSRLRMGGRNLELRVLRETSAGLGFELFLIHIPGLLDRPEVYGWPDEAEQFIAFQIAFLEWITRREIRPDIVHCHDHHAGLVPFLMYHAPAYAYLKRIPTVGTVHNAQYQGRMNWDKAGLLPAFDTRKSGLLDWDHMINPLAALIKCCWKYTAVSPGYLGELSRQAGGLESLFSMEAGKGAGILNGIDTSLWNPETDPMIPVHYGRANHASGKLVNKQKLCKAMNLQAGKPLIAYIGRMVWEKGADLLPDIIGKTLKKHAGNASFLVLGSGEKQTEEALLAIAERFPRLYAIRTGYDESLAHQIYAAADFLLMPSRVEPCGLNQLYSMRYGTIPVVRRTGGLKDTVPDFEQDPEGYGICFEETNADDACEALDRALELYTRKPLLRTLRKRMMKTDIDWNRSAGSYIDLYNQLILPR